MQGKADGMRLNTKSHRAGFKQVLLRTCIFLRMQIQNDKIKAVKHLLAKCDLSLSLHISQHTHEHKKSEKRTQGVLKEVLPYKKKKNSGVFDDRWLHISLTSV